MITETEFVLRCKQCRYEWSSRLCMQFSERETWKKNVSGFKGIWTQDLCDTRKASL